MSNSKRTRQEGKGEVRQDNTREAATITYWIPGADVDIHALLFYMTEYVDETCDAVPGQHYQVIIFRSLQETQN